MSDFTLRIVSTIKEALEDKHSIIWMKGDEWDDDVDLDSNDLTKRTVIFTSSWQMGVFRNAGMGLGSKNYFIVPQGSRNVRFRVPDYSGRIDIVWRGTDTGSAIMLATVANALKLNAENCSIKFFGNATPLLMQVIDKKRDEVISDFTEDQYEDALSDAHMFVYPAFRFHSQHMPTVQAAKAGCVCLVPNNSGFREILGPFGGYIHHSLDNVDYAQSLASRLQSAIGAFRDVPESVAEAVTAASSISSLNFSLHYQENWIDSVKAQLASLEVNRIEEGAPNKLN